MQMDHDLPDIVRDYRLTTQCSGDITTHLYNDPDAPPSAPQRAERWEKVRTLGQGGQGRVILETCTAGDRNHTQRAVKIIRLRDGESKRHYKRELEAIVKFSHDKV